MRQLTTPRQRWAFWLLRLYPRRWRDRYFREMTALLEEHHIMLRTLADWFGGALDAQLRRQDQFERSGPMRSTRSLLQAQLAVFWLFPVFFVAVLYRTSQMIDWNEPSPIGNYFNLVEHYPALNLLAATVGVATAVALLAQIISGLLLLRSGGWIRRAFVAIAFMASVAAPALYFGSSLGGTIAVVVCLEVVAVVLLALSRRLSATDATEAQSAGWGSFVWPQR